MPAPSPFLDLDSFPMEPILDREGINRLNRQRFEWEQLTAITLLDFDRRLVAGYRDYRDDEWWARGHFPGHAMVPGVLMMEAAAQACSVYVAHFKLTTSDEIMAFGGMDDVRFRGVVTPGKRMLLVGHAAKNSSKIMRVHVQGFVEGQMVFHGVVIGMPLKTDQATR
jgi:3-hydroxyacyl-[acyl-carrier-protein] dehydratase